LLLPVAVQLAGFCLFFSVLAKHQRYLAVFRN
jgi:hypothetical protein